MSQPSKEEFAEWRLHPVTRSLVAQMRGDRERLKECWANGEFSGSPEADAKARGQCEVISQFLALEEQDLEDEE